MKIISPFLFFARRGKKNKLKCEDGNKMPLLKNQINIYGDSMELAME